MKASTVTIVALTNQVAIAEQTHQMVADRLKRLTTDLATFEQVD